MHSDSHLYSGHVHAVSTAFHGNCNLRERAVEGNDALRNSHLYAMMHSEIATCMPAIMLYQTRQCNSGNGMTLFATYLPASQNNEQRQGKKYMMVIGGHGLLSTNGILLCFWQF